MPKPPIRHRVIRTRNKHSRAILHDGTILIRLARNLSVTEEREHIRDLLQRMTRYAIEERRRTVIHPFRTLLDGGQSVTMTLASGKKYVFALEAGDRTTTKKMRGGWKITVGPGLKRRGLHGILWDLVSEAEFSRIEALVHRLNAATYNARISQVRLKFASSQWGSCSPRGVIMVNAALLVLPPRLLKYIIVHELAHRRRADHSPAFWAEVAWGMPGYESARAQLDDYRLPTL